MKEQMKEQQWQTIKNAFEESSDRSVEDRLRILNDLEPDLRLEVERMLKSYDSDRSSGHDSVAGLPGPGFWSRLIHNEHSFEPGQILNGRFEILSFLGAGGMGEVYHARDRQLGEVAIKTLRIEFNHLESTLDRFRREVSRGRQVSHPNVCRIHDLFETDSTATIPFFTMEYLPGQTLSSTIRASGPMPAVEALPIALDLCAGLGAAHEARIVHGDFKGANVMLSRDSAAPWQVKIMDFGLADILPQPDAQSEPARAALAGTRLYLAPELLNGASPSIASDIFALGVVLHHLRLGTYPFPADASAQQLIPSPSFDQLAQSLEAPWASAIAACLDANPARRPTSTQDVSKLLRGLNASSSSRRLWLGSLILGAGVTSVISYSRRDRLSPLAALIPSQSKLRVLTEDFAAINLSPAYGRTLSNLIRLCLQGSNHLLPVPTREIQSALTSLGRESQPLRGATAQSIAVVTSAGLLLSGSIRPAGGLFLVECKAQAPASLGLVWGPQSISVGPNDIPHAASVLASSLRRACGESAPPTQIAGIQLDQADSRAPDALEHFSLALTYYAQGESQPALKTLAEAQRIDPDFALAHLLEAQIHTTFRREDLALPPLEKSYALRSRLNARHRNHIEYQFYVLHGDYSRSHDQIRSMVQIYPDDATYHRQFAHSCALIGKPDLGLDSARQAYRLDPASPMASNALASSLAESGRFAEAHQHLAATLAATPQSTPLLFAKAYVHLLELDFPPAIAVLEDLSRRVRPAVLTNYQLAKAKLLSGNFPAARLDLERDLPLLEQSGEFTNAAIYRYWLGQIALLNSDPAAASQQAEALALVPARDQFLSALRFTAELAWLSRNTGIFPAIHAKLNQIHTAYSSSRSSSFRHFATGAQHAANSNWPLAASEFRQAHSFWPDLANAWAAGEALLADAKPALAANYLAQAVAAQSSAIRFDSGALWIRSLARLASLNQSTSLRSQFERLWGDPGRFPFSSSHPN